MASTPPSSSSDDMNQSPGGFHISPRLEPELKDFFKQLNEIIKILGVSPTEFDREVQYMLATQCEVAKLYVLEKLATDKKFNCEMPSGFLTDDLPHIQAVYKRMNRDLVFHLPPKVIRTDSGEDAFPLTEEHIKTFIDGIHEHFEICFAAQGERSPTLQNIANTRMIDTPGTVVTDINPARQNPHLLSRLGRAKIVMASEDRSAISYAQSGSYVMLTCPFHVQLDCPANHLGYAVKNAVWKLVKKTKLGLVDEEKVNESLDHALEKFDLAITGAGEQVTARSRTPAEFEALRAALSPAIEEQQQLINTHPDAWDAWSERYSRQHGEPPLARVNLQICLLDNTQNVQPEQAEQFARMIEDIEAKLTETRRDFIQYLEGQERRRAHAEMQNALANNGHSNDKTVEPSFLPYEFSEAQKIASRIARKGNENVAAGLKAGPARNMQALYEYIWTQELEPLQALLNRKDPVEAELGDAIFAEEIMSPVEFIIGYDRAKPLSATPTSAVERLGRAIQTAFNLETLEAMNEEQLTARLKIWDRLAQAPSALLAVIGKETVTVGGNDATYFDLALKTYRDYATNVDPQRAVSNKILFVKAMEPRMQEAISQLGLEHAGPYCHHYIRHHVTLPASMITRDYKPGRGGSLSHVMAVQKEINKGKGRAFP